MPPRTARSAAAQDPSRPSRRCRQQVARSRQRRAACSVRRRRSIAPSRSICRPTSSSTTPRATGSIAQGNVEIYYNNYILTADQVIYDQSANKLTAEGNVAAEGPQRQHHPRRPLHAHRRLPRRLRAVAERGHHRRHPHRRRARHAPRRQHHRVHEAAGSRLARTTPACRRCGASAPHASSTISARRRITYQDAQFELFGVPVLYLPYFQHPDPSVKRKSGFLMPSVRSSSTARLQHRDPLLLRAGAELRLHLPPALLLEAGRAVAGRLAPAARQRRVHGRAGRHRSGQSELRGQRCRFAPPPRPTACAAASSPGANSRFRAGGRRAGTSRSRATTRSGASISLTVC